MASNLLQSKEEKYCVLCNLPNAEKSCDTAGCQLCWHKLCTTVADVPCPLQHVPKKEKGKSSMWDEALIKSVKQHNCKPGCSRNFLLDDECDVYACNECGVLKCLRCIQNFFDKRTLGLLRHTHYVLKDGSVLCRAPGRVNGKEVGTRTATTAPPSSSNSSGSSSSSGGSGISISRSGPGLSVRLFFSIFFVFYV
jgi:hypothetical protein